MKLVTIIEKKIKPTKKERKVFGTWDNGRITIDPRQSARERFDTLAHEVIHHWESHCDFELSEDAVENLAGALTHVLYDLQGYRRKKCPKTGK